MADNSDLKIEKLKGSINYHQWKEAIINLLTLRDLDDCVNIDDIDKPAVEEDPVKLKKAAAFMKLYIHKTVVSSVKGCKTAQEVWKLLAENYNDEGLMRQVNLFLDLIEIKHANFPSTEQYVQKMMEQMSLIEDAGLPIPEIWKGIILLAGLGPEFKSWIMGIQGADLNITGASVQSKLIDCARERNKDNSAFKAWQPQQRKNYRGNNRKNFNNSEVAHSSNSNNPQPSGSNSNQRKNRGRKNRNSARVAKNSQTVENAWSAWSVWSDDEEENVFELQTEKADSSNVDHITVKDIEVVPTPQETQVTAEPEIEANLATEIGEAALKASSNSGVVWTIDSGASKHMTHHSEYFDDTNSVLGQISTASDERLQITSRGKLNLSIQNRDITISNVCLVPKLTANLLSVNKIATAGNKVIFEGNKCSIINSDGVVLATCIAENGIYQINSSVDQCMLVHRPAVDIFTWHRRLGHVNGQTLLKMSTLGNGLLLSTKDVDRLKECVVCAEGKHSRTPFPASNSKTKKVLALVHSDLCGPMQTQSIGGSKYFLTFVDDFSRKLFIYLLSAKSQTFAKFKEFKSFAELQTGEKIQCLRTDGGGEYNSTEFKSFLADAGIQHQQTAANSPQQNGVAERINRTIIEKGKCLMFDANLPKMFWADAVKTVEYIYNRTLTSSINAIPDEVFFGKKIDVYHLRAFGCRVMVMNTSNSRRKLDRKSTQMIFIGYDPDKKAYRCYDKSSRKVIVSRDVIFHENYKIAKPPPVRRSRRGSDSDSDDSSVSISWINRADETQPEKEEDSEHSEHSDEEEEEQSDVEGEEEQEEEEEEHDEREGDASGDDNAENDQPPSSPTPPARPPLKGRLEVIDPSSTDKPSTTRSGSGFGFGFPSFGSFGSSGHANLAILLDEGFVYKSTSVLNADDPVTVNDIEGRPDKQLWLDSMQEEMNALQKNRTWTLTDLPPGKKAIKSKWIFKTKFDAAGKLIKRKSRLVAKGFTQRYGIDYEETFSPVVRYTTIRILIAIAVQLRMKIHQMDAVTAFLQGDLSEVIYMEQPLFFDDGSGRVCKLSKSIYGLKQAGRVWNLKLDKMLKNFGLIRSLNDPCLYISSTAKLYVAIYVDDFLILYRDDTELEKLKTALDKSFSMKDLGRATSIIGMRIQYDGNSVSLDQTVYIEEVLKRFGMSDSKGVSTPGEIISVKQTVEKLGEKFQNDDSLPYMEAVGSLIYIAHATRPDIAFAVNRASQYNSCHTLQHWQDVKRIFRYLQETKNHKLIYSRSSNNTLLGFCDSDHANSPDRKSTTGYIFLMSNAAVSWCSQKQKIIALSSTEAEFIALASAMQDALWLKQVLDELHFDIGVPHLQCDNTSTIHIAKNNNYSARTKHIDLREKCLVQRMQLKHVSITHVATTGNVADYLTKNLNRPKHEQFRLMSGIRP